MPEWIALVIFEPLSGLPPVSFEFIHDINEEVMMTHQWGFPYERQGKFIQINFWRNAPFLVRDEFVRCFITHDDCEKL